MSKKRTIHLRVLLVLVLILLAAIWQTSSAYAGLRIDFGLPFFSPPPPEPIYVSPPPPPGPTAVWVPGQYQWDGYRWVWYPGHYAYPPYPDAVWLDGYWAVAMCGWVAIGGITIIRNPIESSTMFRISVVEHETHLPWPWKRS